MSATGERHGRFEEFYQRHQDELARFNIAISG
jgi:hypothetical protein